MSVGNKPRRLTHPLERDPIMSKLIKMLLVVACAVAGAAGAAGVAGVAGAPSEKAKVAAVNRFAVSVRPMTEAERAHAAAVYAAEPWYASEAAMAAQECDIDYSTPDCQLDDYTADDAAAAAASQ